MVTETIRGFVRGLMQDLGLRGKVSASSQTAYGDASALQNRRTYGWNPGLTDGSRELFSEGRALRNRIRELVRQDSIARAIVDSWTANLIGDGIVPRSLHPNEETRKKLHGWFEKFAAQSDSDGILTFYGQQALWAGEMVTGGECIIRVRPRLREDGLFLPMQLQTIPAEQIPEWKNEYGVNGYTRGGIEFDALGRRVAMQIYRDHPGSGLLNASELRRVPIKDGTAPQLIHMFVVRRAGQVRGEPWMAPVLMKIQDLHKYSDAKLVKSKAAAYFLMTVTSPAGNPLELPTDQNFEGSNAQIDSPIIEPNTVLRLDPGEKMEYTQPPADQDYEPFIKSHTKMIARGSGTTYAQISGDTREANFSSMRADEMIFRRRCSQIQQLNIIPCLDKIWGVFIDYLGLAGLIPARELATNGDLYRAVHWQTPAWPKIQPLQDTEADIAEVRAGFATREQKVAERGGDVEDIDAQTAKDNARADTAGIIYDSDGRQSKQGGAAGSAASQPADGASSDGQQNGSAETAAA